MDRRQITIEGTGAALPPSVLASSELDRRYNKPAGWFAGRTGITHRHVCNGSLASELAAQAATAALSAANLKPDDIDIIISAAAVPEQPIPAMGPLIQRRLDLSHKPTPAFDINSSCLSFLTAVDMSCALIESGRAHRVLVVSSEVASRALPWDDDPETAAMFGDGAAAAIISASANAAPSRMVASLMHTYPDGYHYCELPAGGTRYDFNTDRASFEANATFRMDGRAVYRLTAKVIEPFLGTLLAAANWSIRDIDWIVPHQASRGALDHLIRMLGVPREKLIDVLATHGNQIAASLPSALNAGVRSGRIKRGDKVLMIGTSAGLSLGALALVY